MKNNNNYFKYLWLLLVLSIACVSSLQAGKHKFLILQTTYTIDDQLFQDDISHFLCKYCGGLIENAHQDPLNSNICKSCGTKMQEYIQKNQADNQQCSEGSLQSLFPNKKVHGIIIEKVLESLIKHLQAIEEQSYQSSPNPDLEDKIKACHSHFVECEDCEESVPFNFVVTHAKEHCYQCASCYNFTPKGSDTFRKNQVEEHEVACPQKLITCQHCEGQYALGVYGFHCIQKMLDESHGFVTCPICGQSVLGSRYTEHYATLHFYDQSCPNHCPDCDKKYQNGTKLLEHATSEHPQTIFELTAAKTNKFRDSKQTEKKHLLHIIKVFQLGQISTKENSTTSTMGAISDVKQQMASQDTLFTNMQHQLIAAKQALQTLKNDHDRGKNKFDEMQRLQLDEVKRLMASLNDKMSNLELQLKANLATTYNGVFYFTINDIDQKIQDAKSGKTSYIFSAPFFTGEPGYKLCVRVYLNGDGAGHGTCLSVFIALMQGEFDNMLNWPFEHKISLTLISYNDSKHITQTFHPTKTSSSFQKPKSEFNIATGCPEFCPLDYIQPEGYQHEAIPGMQDMPKKTLYRKNNEICIKCIVDTSTIQIP